MAETHAEMGYDDIGLDSGLKPDVRELPAWTVSLVVHVVVLALLWSIRLATFSDADLEITSRTDPVQTETLKFAVAQDEEIDEGRQRLAG
ncbi:MAG: hypothetical protein ACE5KM_10770, partial [Planctomycetaceae bacterium]